MTIVTTATSSGPYTATADTTFAVTFQSAGDDEIEVTLDDVVQSPSLYGFDRDADGTGEVTFITAVTGEVMIYSAPLFDQQTSFSRFGAFFPDQINTPMDKAAVKSLYLKSLLTPSVATVAARASRYLAYDALGDPAYLDGTDSGATDDNLVSHISAFGATRTVNAVLDDMPWLSSFAGATDTLKWRQVISDQASCVRLPNRLMTVDLGTTPLAPTAPITIEAAGGRDSPDLYNNSNCLFMQTLGSGMAGPITISMRGFTLRGNTAKANCGGLDAYDNGNGKIADMILQAFNKTALRFKYGVGLDLDNLRIAGVTGAVDPVIELTGDGSAVGNGALLKNVYITFGPTLLRVYRFNNVNLDTCNFEYFDDYGIDAESGNGLMKGTVFENDASFVGNVPFRTVDFNMGRKFSGWNYGTPVSTWAGVAGEQRMHEVDDRQLGYAYRDTEFTPTTSLAIVPLTTDGDQFYVTRSANKLIGQRAGMMLAGFDASIVNGDAATQTCSIRLVKYPVGGGAAVEVPGSLRYITLLAGQGTYVSVDVPIQMTIGDALALEFGASDVDVHLKAAPGSSPTGTSVATAALRLRSIGLSK